MSKAHGEQPTFSTHLVEPNVFANCSCNLLTSGTAANISADVKLI